MTTPTIEQVVQWADEACNSRHIIRPPINWQIDFATLARADLEAKVAELESDIEIRKEMQKQSDDVIADLSNSYSELEAEVARLKTVTHVTIPTNTMEQWVASEIRIATQKLRQQLAASQEEVALVKSRYAENIEYNKELKLQLSASQLEAKVLRSALLKAIGSCFDRQSFERHKSDPSYFTNQAISNKPGDTALREYCAGMVEKIAPAFDTYNRNKLNQFADKIRKGETL